jgi:hypothetical protein
MTDNINENEEEQSIFVPSDEGLPVPIRQLHPTLPEIMNNQATINIGICYCFVVFLFISVY